MKTKSLLEFVRPVMAQFVSLTILASGAVEVRAGDRENRRRQFPVMLKGDRSKIARWGKASGDVNRPKQGRRRRL